MTDSEIFQLILDVLTDEEFVEIDGHSRITINAVRKLIEAAKEKDKKEGN
ncbi:hypothetical protein [Parvicella tangerina]|uniref:Uncharacterized protein n=1 Tax=Parvicella tangerina TaxID=2829795 RepID=A0A916JN58_9FLAO|nr:hypothetical protein [Parvicella tangerina]CAG5082240.1 hypothetical protein CRYO30217_01850 [Parvicella tangerina]